MRESFLTDVLHFEPISFNEGLPHLYSKDLGDEGIQLIVNSNDGSTWIAYQEGDQSVGIGSFDEEELNELLIILELGINKE